jgi:hypothetical protein
MEYYKQMGLISGYRLMALNDDTCEISKKDHEINNNEMQIQSRFEPGNLM